jgi:hypothetical protein
MMATKVGVGESKKKDSFEAGSEAARSALNRAEIEKCDFVFLYATVGYDQLELLKGVRSVTGNATLSGCSGEGVITQAGPEGEIVFTQSGTKKGINAVGVMVISSDEIVFNNFVGYELKKDSKKAGEEIGEKIANAKIEEPLLLMMFLDGLTVNVKEFFLGIDTFIQKPLKFCGGLAADDFAYRNTYQYYNDQVLSDAASCVLISGNVKIELGVSHGCFPIGLEKTITKSKSNTVYDVDRKPVWDFYKQYLDPEMKEFNNEINTFLDLGEKLPDELATEYDKYIIRAPVSQNPDGSLNFATEIPEGTNVQLIRRDADKISMNAKRMAERIKAELREKKPIAILHVDCCARGKMFFGGDAKEKGIDVMQDVFGKDVPWLGFYSYGEISPIRNENYYHNQTAVLCLIYK